MLEKLKSITINYQNDSCLWGKGKADSVCLRFYDMSSLLAVATNSNIVNNELFKISNPKKKPDGTCKITLTLPRYKSDLGIRADAILNVLKHEFGLPDQLYISYPKEAGSSEMKTTTIGSEETALVAENLTNFLEIVAFRESSLRKGFLKTLGNETIVRRNTSRYKQASCLSVQCPGEEEFEQFRQNILKLSIKYKLDLVFHLENASDEEPPNSCWMIANPGYSFIDMVTQLAAAINQASLEKKSCLIVTFETTQERREFNTRFHQWMEDNELDDKFHLERARNIAGANHELCWIIRANEGYNLNLFSEKGGMQLLMGILQRRIVMPFECTN